MKTQPDVSSTPEVRSEHIELIQYLAQQQFIQLKIGKPSDFKKLWNQAFIDDDTCSRRHE